MEPSDGIVRMAMEMIESGPPDPPRAARPPPPRCGGGLGDEREWPFMARKRKEDPDQLGLLEARVATAPLAPDIREKVKAWREGDYKGVSETTRVLLNYWFYTDHRLPNGRKFAYHYFQREAIETLIYLYEAAKVRRHKSLVETFATRSDLRLLQYDDFARYCVKMATGSGKTKVMSLAIAWQFSRADLTTCSLEPSKLV